MRRTLIIRSGSRLVKADNLSYDTRCPIILTAESNFNRIFVNSVGIKAAKAELEKKF